MDNLLSNIGYVMIYLSNVGYVVVWYIQCWVCDGLYIQCWVYYVMIYLMLSINGLIYPTLSIFLDLKKGIKNDQKGNA